MWLLRTVKGMLGEAEADCAICRGKGQASECSMATACGHAFCFKCLKDYKKHKPEGEKCALCRQNIHNLPEGTGELLLAPGAGLGAAGQGLAWGSGHLTVCDGCSGRLDA
jgi:hypothetical protein